MPAWQSELRDVAWGVAFRGIKGRCLFEAHIYLLKSGLYWNS